MNEIFLKKENGTVKVFYSEEAMNAAGYTEADLIVSEEEFNGAGCYAQIIDDEIVVGKTAEEIAEEEKAEKIAEIDADLAALDKKYLTPRILSGIGTGDPYALGERQKHEAAAAPLRAKREALQ